MGEGGLKMMTAGDFFLVLFFPLAMIPTGPGDLPSGNSLLCVGIGFALVLIRARTASALFLKSLNTRFPLSSESSR